MSGTHFFSTMCDFENERLNPALILPAENKRLSATNAASGVHSMSRTRYKVGHEEWQCSIVVSLSIYRNIHAMQTHMLTVTCARRW
jgi:hypothetical protein